MREIKQSGENVYRLVFRAAGDKLSQFIEFEGSGPQAALYLVTRLCAGREAEVFENGRSLGRIRADAHGGFWEITPASTKPKRPTLGLFARRRSVANDRLSQSQDQSQQATMPGVNGGGPVLN